MLTLEARTRTYLAMTVGGYAIGMPLNLYEANWIMSHGFSGLAYHQANITYDFAGWRRRSAISACSDCS